MDFFSPKPKADPERLAFIKDRIRDLFALDDESTVMVSELRCSEPGCPPLETVIAILREGSKRQFKIHKSVAEVSDADLDALLPSD